jgi:putative endonuclease
VSGRITRIVLRFLDRLTPAGASANEGAPHRKTGQHGEEEAYFYLRRRGYVMVARNFRSPRHHGEIDLIGWDKDVLCFIEVKTQTTHDVKPAEAAVDREKRRALRKVVRDYLQALPDKMFPELPAWRFDVLTVYFERPAVAQDEENGHVRARHDLKGTRPTFELFQNAALSA